jgi:hypothetical protein
MKVVAATWLDELFIYGKLNIIAATKMRGAC